MGTPYIKRDVQIASGSDTSNAISFDSDIDTRALILCGVKLSSAITAVTANIQMSATENGTYANIYDETKTMLDFTIETASYTRLKPYDYAIFDSWGRIKLSANASASVTISMFFRPA